jgi:hypothetical protein
MKGIFIESICNDEKRILENIMNSKVDTKATKDYRGVDVSTAVSDFQERVAKYAEVYETLTEKDLIWIKLIDGGREMTSYGDFWPGGYSRTHVGARQRSYAAVMAGLRAGRIWVDHGWLLGFSDGPLRRRRVTG